MTVHVGTKNLLTFSNTASYAAVGAAWRANHHQQIAGKFFVRRVGTLHSRPSVVLLADAALLQAFRNLPSQSRARACTAQTSAWIALVPTLLAAATITAGATISEVT
jgi:hypothetical protein